MIFLSDLLRRWREAIWFAGPARDLAEILYKRAYHFRQSKLLKQLDRGVGLLGTQLKLGVNETSRTKFVEDLHITFDTLGFEQIW